MALSGSYGTTERDTHSAAATRADMRRAYRCDCSGPMKPGTTRHAATAVGVRRAAEAWTGDEPRSCPWRPFYFPFVQRVLKAYRWFEKGQLASFDDDPSARLVEGLSHYHQALTSARANALEEARRNAEQRAAS